MSMRKLLTLTDEQHRITHFPMARNLSSVTDLLYGSFPFHHHIEENDFADAHHKIPAIPSDNDQQFSINGNHQLKKSSPGIHGYTANTSCGRMRRGGDARFHTFPTRSPRTDGPTDGPTDGQSLL